MTTALALQSYLTFEKSAKKDSRRIVGVASTDSLDRQQQVVDLQSLADAAKLYMRNPIVFHMHNWNAPIGHTVAFTVAKSQLVVEVEIGKGFLVPVGMTTMPVDDIWAQIEQGLLRAFSIGFNADLISRENEPDRLTNIDLFEISVVSIPANAEAVFGVAKSYALPRDVYGLLFKRQHAAGLFDSAPDQDAQGSEQRELERLVARVRDAGGTWNESHKQHDLLRHIQELKTWTTRH